MPIQRNNDEERASLVERLSQEYRRERTPVIAIESPRTSTGLERRVQGERRRGRSDAELRAERDELERQWNEQHRRGTGTPP